MYSIPDFANLGKGGSVGMTPQMDMGSLGGMSSTENQWMSFPSMSGGMPSTGGPLDMTAPQATPPGIVPPAGGSLPDPTGGHQGFTLNDPLIGGKHKLGGGATTEPTLDPGFTSQLYAWLQSQMGKGATPFDLSAILPSTGDVTAPGTLTAPDNPILKALQEFYTKGTGGPLPGVLPMWQSEMKAMEIPIEKQMANIKEQFGARGALGSSEMASAMETFGTQTARDQEALLGELTLQALPGMETAGMNLQSLDQKSIDNLVQEFIRTRPEYSPLLGEEAGLATTFSPLYGHTGFGAAFGSAFGGGLGSGLAKGLTDLTFGDGNQGGGQK
jgi:hypothetical protein